MFKTDAIALSSPSGRMSKRARKAALDRISRELFGDGTCLAPTVRQESEEERDMRTAKNYRGLASRGMHPRKYIKEALRLEGKWK